MLQNDTGTVSGEVVSSLQETDWNQEWMRLQRIRRHADDKQYWNTRSRNFSDFDSPGDYVRGFLALAGIEPASEVLDMGCGTGSIAVALALDGCKVLAADFSESMLAATQKRAAQAGVEGVSTRLLAWADDWQAAGIGPGSFDVALASRSISTDDMEAALDKLTACARTKCCITLPTGCSPRMDERVLEVCGIRNRHGADHQYAWNILQNKGMMPTCSYIRSVRKDTFATIEQACTDMGRMIDDTLDPRDAERIGTAKERLRIWLEGQLVENPDAGKPDRKGNVQGPLTLREPRVVTWAFISWDARGRG